MQRGKNWPIICNNLETAQDRCKLVLINNTKFIWDFDWYQNRWPWMTLNSVMAVILLYSAEFGRGQLRQSGWRQTHTSCPLQKCSPNDVTFNSMWLIAIFVEIIPITDRTLTRGTRLTKAIIWPLLHDNWETVVVPSAVLWHYNLPYNTQLNRL